jgi:hypothetical protein
MIPRSRIFEEERPMSNVSCLHFVQQQGFVDADRQNCDSQYSSLMFQPRLIGAIVLVGLIFQAWPLFLALAAILWWNVIVPSRNPFDALYNKFVSGRKDLPRLQPAPAPRRFAQGMAATFMVGIGISLVLGWHVAAWVLEGFLIVAVTALIFGKFCLGSYVYYLLRGENGFANRTLPWARESF